MKYTLKVVSLIVSISAFIHSVQAGDFKARLLNCQQRKISEQGLDRTENFRVSGNVVCYSGRIVNFVDCRRDNKDQTISFDAPEGFEIIEGVRFSDVSSTNRGSYSSLSANKRSASVKIHCRGNACDTGEREWMEGAISGVIKKIPTKEQSDQIQNDCLDELGL